ncbi:hypothetical protein FA13DRAFT_1793778 [Coprinellus micaceus]|uniref:Integral membrane protein n=1 Tax=Coprinellus micaceus TaxID=71717 RepID=A0A4Y7T357_COPMI|nr:hypothetical protein FA13DRAFT_1793778 [Coprinellus micaceus]
MRLTIDWGSVAFYNLYIYYVLTTMAQEVSIILPQKWGQGKMLYGIIRYGTLIFIALQLIRDYRNYFSISPTACKVLYIACIRGIAYLACAFSLGLCLGALLRMKLIGVAAVCILSFGVPFVNGVIGLVSYFQYPAEPISPLDTELGYPCYFPGTESLMETTVLFVGREPRAYMNMVANTLLAVLAIVALVTRYKEQSGGLVKVIRRDSGLHYLSLLVVGLASAVVQTRAVIAAPELDASPVSLLLDMANAVVIPILAQRLLINMRKVDYMGSEPFASKLLFAPPPPGSEDDPEGDVEAIEMTQEPHGLRRQGSTGGGSERDNTGVRGSTV